MLNYFIVKNKYDCYNESYVMILDIDDCSIEFVKQYCLYNIGSGRYTFNSLIISDVLDKVQFFTSHINILNKSYGLKLIYEILRSRNVHPTLELMEDIYLNKRCNIFPDVYSDFITKIKNLNLIHPNNIGKQEFEFIANKDSERNYIYITHNVNKSA